jgi:hypothetical protein
VIVAASGVRDDGFTVGAGDVAVGNVSGVF